MAEHANATLNISDDVFRSIIRRRPLVAFIIHTLIIGVIVVVGIIGNCLTFVVFWKGNFKSSTSFLFLSLSLIDSAFLLTVFPQFCVGEFVEYTGWFKGFSSVKPFLIVYGNFILSSTKSATIWVTVLVAVNRYIIVCRPLRASQWCTISRVKIQLAVVLVLAVVCNISALFNYRIKYNARNNGTSYAIGVDYGMIVKWQSFHKVYDTVVLYTYNTTVWTVVPLFILTLLTIRLIKAMKAHRRMQLEMNSLQNQQDNNMTFALILVVVVFVICHVPRFLVSMLWIVVPIEVLVVNEVWYVLDHLSVVLVILNSAVNFAIYTLANKRFREVLTKTICRRRTPTERRVVTARQMARAEVGRDEPDDVNETPL